jgi:hypothetical protein
MTWNASSIDFERDVNSAERASLIAPGDDRDALLEQMLGERAQVVVRRVIAQRFRSGRIGLLRDDEREDLGATALLRVLQRLRATDESDGPIVNFEGYVAMVTLHACDDLLRERLPRRTAAKNRLCYVLGHDRRFAQWTIDGETVCGLHEWRGAETIGRNVTMDDVRHLAGDRDVRRLLTAIFFAAQRPVELETVVNIAAELWEMIDRPSVALDDVDPIAFSAATTSMEDRQFLAKLWEEIRLLHRPQRAALLLNLRDEGGPATELFPLLGVATVAEIADAVGLPADAFAAIWPELPIGDLRIAAILDVTRQQVINLRKSARDRLRRRMRY